MDLFIKLLVAMAVFFVPFSFAGTEPWAFSVLQGLVVTAWIGLLFSWREMVYPSLCKGVLYVFGVLIGLALVQSLFPHTLLEGPFAYPVTLMRLYTLEHASVFMTYAGVVLLVMQLYPSFEEVEKLTVLLVCAGAAVALCALILPDGEYIYRLTGLRKGYAAVGPFLNRNHGGLFLVMNALLSLGLLFTHQLDYKQQMGASARRTFWVRQGWLLALSVFLMTMAVWSRSRGAMLSLFIGLFTYALLCVWCVPAQFKKRLKRIFYTLALLTVSSAWIYTHIPDINQFAHRGSGASEQIRQMLYRAGGDILQKYPVWGVGIGAMPVIINEYTEYDLHQYIERLHNDWLEITLGVGLAGAVLLLVGLVWCGYKSVRTLKQLDVRKQFLFASLLSTLGALCVGSTVDFHFFIPGCAFTFFCVLGLVLAPTFHPHHVHRCPAVLARVTLLALLLAAGWVPLQKTMAWRAFRLGKGLKTPGKLASYQTGLSYYPTPRYAVRLANAYYNAGVRAQDTMERVYYYELARETAENFLEKYPKDKELSKLYLRTHRALNRVW